MRSGSLGVSRPEVLLRRPRDAAPRDAAPRERTGDPLALPHTLREPPLAPDVLTVGCVTPAQAVRARVYRNVGAVRRLLRPTQDKFTALPGDVIIGGAPTGGNADELAALGIKSVVSMLAPYELNIPTGAYGAQRVMNLPTADFSSPSATQLESVRDFVVACDKPVLIHCREGRGRSAVAAAVALVALGEAPDVAAAHDVIAARRNISSFRSRQWNVARGLCDRQA